MIDLQVSESLHEATICFVDADNSSAINIGTNQYGRGMSVKTQDGELALSFGVDSTGTGPFEVSEGYLMIRNTENKEQLLFPNSNTRPPKKSG